MSAQTLVYIEDEDDYQILVERILSRAGLEVEMAGSGEEGLAALRRKRPGMLILDVNLPDTDGYAICNLLRGSSEWVDLPILMLTVRRRPEEWLRGFSCGANDYLCKPLDPSELIERVRNCLAGKARQFSNAGTPEYHLIQAAVTGNRAAFEVLIRKYKARLVENVRHLTRGPDEAEDVVSYSFVTAFEKMGEFRGEASFYTWLYRIAMNEAADARRKSRGISIEELTRGDESVLPASLTTKDPTPDEVSLTHELVRIRAVLGQVPQPYRRLLQLYFFKNLPYQAIADKLNMPLGTVMSRLSKARQLLRDLWNRRPLIPA